MPLGHGEVWDLSSRALFRLQGQEPGTSPFVGREARGRPGQFHTGSRAAPLPELFGKHLF
jgi:hypothetical protein